MRVYNIERTREKRKNLRKSQTDAEKKLWSKVRDAQFLGLKFYRQYGIGEYITDFYCPKQRLAIEIDGGQHFTNDGRAYDRQRCDFFRSLEIKTLRFSNLDVLKSVESVLEKIKGEFQNSP